MYCEYAVPLQAAEGHKIVAVLYYFQAIVVFLEQSVVLFYACSFEGCSIDHAAMHCCIAGCIEMQLIEIILHILQELSLPKGF